MGNDGGTENSSCRFRESRNIEGRVLFKVTLVRLFHETITWSSALKKYFLHDYDPNSCQFC